LSDYIATSVMAELVAAIHVFVTRQDVDARNKFRA